MSNETIFDIFITHFLTLRLFFNTNGVSYKKGEDGVERSKKKKTPLWWEEQ